MKKTQAYAQPTVLNEAGLGNSRSIHTTQDAPHEELIPRVLKHLHEPFLKPYQAHNLQAFKAASQWLKAQNKPLILDSCCGIGESTRQLAKLFPDHAVIGVDQSETRINRQHGEVPDNALLVRANLLDFWRLAANAHWKPVRHYLFYPNPYPKKSQFKLRWHGGAMLPFIVRLGGIFECRSNWQLYVQEMAMAYSLLREEGLLKAPLVEQQARLAEVAEQVVAIQPELIMTPFERKYLASGQQVYGWVYL
ncbi:tRNA G46 methylase TrmB [Oceanospirillum multiglobuliferum]|uniref:tRNA (guanine(46)-N(7))-methyltransferase n=1 Tax=Oceanospirillum multiglobuliferum TaxID=64969 RepID=A0A1T4SK06_9GAMM|nr:hypothetical protein [Oceanospirillum multiglobuliferum]OPX54208.1 hypothetical protein BTE48_15360 [Oceanospirillum multiglobuliferum]SKA28493.1 tRNA G46 methylase TrmB [Oceanospirillum multiglobuliferum]